MLFVIGANIGECAPITTDYIWRARDKGAKLIVADPRFTPIARNADLYLPVRPGTDLALLMGMLHVIIRDGLTDPAFIEAHTTGFEKTAESVEAWNPRRAAEVSGVAPEAIEKAAHWIGESRRAMLMHARGLEHQSKGVENCEAVVAIALATGNIGREGAGPHHGDRAGQRPGRPRARPEVRPVARPAEPHRSGRARARGRRLGDLARRIARSPATRAVEIMNAIHSGEIKGLLSICFNPLVSLPDANFTREALEKLEFFGVIDFFLSETAAHADVVLAGSLQEEEEGVTANVEARVIHIQKAVDPPGNARAGFRHHLRPGAPPGPRPVFPVSRAARDLRRTAPGVARRPRRLLRHHLREDRPSRWASSGPAPRSIIPARRGCSRTAGSSIPMARRTS